ncbi:MAG: hypothetical protein M1834_008697 [Cirrosporium novae-zelandiae]|nr:MAG: hypothetical protein M1834_008697 [Cirrosporium novae-zelandiae]
MVPSILTEADQGSNTWNNDFITLDLTSSWQISSPTLKGLTKPSGPPAVANGYLWNSYDSLYLYGGEFSDSPMESPVAFALWEYAISSSTWIEHSNPKTSAGNNSAQGNQAIQRAAEGAGISVAELGRGWYFGGHLDEFTTEGWSNQISRVYLKSLIEYTFPGYTNNGVNNISGGQAAGSDGVWRNVTEGGLQDEAGFTERADGVLVYVPGFGSQGIILGLAGGTNESFTQMNVIDVYDINSSTWYKQATSGSTPEIRVNPCAVAASASDGSSTQIYLYGGQNLIPYGNQTQYEDMWILTIPSFTWIKVDMSNQSVPPARAGHTCNIWDGQIVVVGGYVGADYSCDSPGIYVFNASNLSWETSFTALSNGNTQNQQPSQENSSTGLSGSYGYTVPKAVQSVIGGNALGSATITTPAQTATAGPLATGKPITYTVTQSNGAVVTETGSNGTGGGGGRNSSPSDDSGVNVGAIVAGVIAGLLFVLAFYLGFCAWVYRRQLSLYKNHVAMAQRATAAPGLHEKQAGFAFPGSSEEASSAQKNSSENTFGTAETSAQQGEYESVPTTYPNGLPWAPPGRSSGDRSSDRSNGSTDDLMLGQEPSFLGVMLSPRRSLRVINRD